MSDITFCKLNHLGLLTVRGNDAIKFLQGQCTQDVQSLQPGIASAGAFCTAKGRAITTVRLAIHEGISDCVHLICHRSSADILMRHLQKYILFFRGTTIENQTEQFTAIGLGGAASATKAGELAAERNGFATAINDDRQLLFVENSQLPDLTFSPSSSWEKSDIEQSILWMDSEQTEKWIPQNFSLDETGGISFKKGCYTGQEVIARLHYKGQSKKKLFKVTWNGPTIENGADIYGPKGPSGKVLQQIAVDDQNYALAILPAEQTESLFADENEQLAVKLLK